MQRAAVTGKPMLRGNCGLPGAGRRQSCGSDIPSTLSAMRRFLRLLFLLLARALPARAESGLVAAFPCNEGAGTTITDITAVHHLGTLTNATATAPRTSPNSASASIRATSRNPSARHSPTASPSRGLALPASPSPLSAPSPSRRQTGSPSARATPPARPAVSPTRHRPRAAVSIACATRRRNAPLLLEKTGGSTARKFLEKDRCHN